jgi:thiamine kinase-like enzyme
MRKITAEKIFKDRPFHRILKIKEVKSLVGLSGKTFQLVGEDGRAFKLRYCSKTGKAKDIERNVQLLPHAFPSFHGRDGHYVLFDWIDGILLPMNPNPDTYHQIGKLIGEAHALEDFKNADPHKYFAARMKELRKVNVLPGSVLYRAEKKYLELRSKVKVDIVLEFNDIHPGNILLDRKGRVFFVDEESLDYSIKGLGLAKPILFEKWFADPRDKQAFWKGYTEFHPIDYFTADYQELIKITYLVRRISTRIQRGVDSLVDIEQLVQMV